MGNVHWYNGYENARFLMTNKLNKHRLLFQTPLVCNSYFVRR